MLVAPVVRKCPILLRALALIQHVYGRVKEYRETLSTRAGETYAAAAARLKALEARMRAYLSRTKSEAAETVREVAEGSREVARAKMAALDRALDAAVGKVGGEPHEGVKQEE